MVSGFNSQSCNIATSMHGTQLAVHGLFNDEGWFLVGRCAHLYSNARLVIVAVVILAGARSKKLSKEEIWLRKLSPSWVRQAHKEAEW